MFVRLDAERSGEKMFGKTPRVTIYTDGACSGNPGPGGWGAVLMCDGSKSELSGGEISTTNNRMELIAAIEGLKHLEVRCSVELFTDSEYVRLGMLKWIRSWKRNNWSRGKYGKLKNADLWKELDKVSSAHDVTWIRVAAHSGDRWNEYVDKLAKSAIPDH